jgi:dienelactone hydrolase
MKDASEARSGAMLWVAVVLLAVCGARPAAAVDGAKLPHTEALDWQGDLSAKMMAGLHRYIEQKIDQSIAARQRLWHRDPTSPEAYQKSVEPNRQRLKNILGVVDSRVPVRMETLGDDASSSVVARTTRYRVVQVRWSVLDGVYGEGLWVEPLGKPLAQVVALPDADQTPEQLLGLAPGVPDESQFARRLATAGFRIIIPVLVDRSDRWSGNPDIGWTNQPHREWIYRQAYHMGRHIIGYELQKILAAVDWFARRDAGLKVGVIGYGEGGLLALDAAALDPRIQACMVSGYFDSRQRSWMEPLYRNVWGFLAEFGDAELATLIAPRGLVVEHSTAPAVDGPPKVHDGRMGGAAVGRIQTPDDASVRAEFHRIDTLLPPGLQTRYLAAGADGTRVGPASQHAIERWARLLGVDAALPLPCEIPADRRKGFDPAERQRRQVKELEDHVQRLVRTADAARDRFFLDKAAPEYAWRRIGWTTVKHIDTWPVAPLVEKVRPYRQYLWEEGFGKLDDPPLPPAPRSRQIYDTPKWAGYEVVLDVFPDVFAWGVLLVPKDIRPGEKRPVVVCQHGRHGLPADVITANSTAYNRFAAVLADRGFIVFAPHNPYHGEDRYRVLSRKANGVKASLFSFILAQHQQILRWLARLPEVDARRIAFYGLSYGGETAIRVPPLLEGYCLSICSGDFNDWSRKVAATDSPLSFMYSMEWEMPYFNLGSTFNYAEMAYLMIPRPFMVERGHFDRVAPDEWVAYEYAKVRRMYDLLGLGDRTEIEFFNGGHSINGRKSFEFLEKHLDWKPRP